MNEHEKEVYENTAGEVGTSCLSDFSAEDPFSSKETADSRRLEGS